MKKLESPQSNTFLFRLLVEIYNAVGFGVDFTQEIACEIRF